jgi:hypothetical protein
VTWSRCVCVSRIFLKRTTHKKYWTSRCSQQLIYLLVVTSWRDQRRTSQLPRNSSRDQNVSSRDATNKIILIIDRQRTHLALITTGTEANRRSASIWPDGMDHHCRHLKISYSQRRIVPVRDGRLTIR